MCASRRIGKSHLDPLQHLQYVNKDMNITNVTACYLSTIQSSEARPLRAYSGQARSMSAKRAESRAIGRQQSSEHAHAIEQQLQQQSQQLAPSTPPLMRESSYDQDADARTSVMSDLDDDASPVGSAVEGGGSSLGEPFDECAGS